MRLLNHFHDLVELPLPAFTQSMRKQLYHNDRFTLVSAFKMYKRCIGICSILDSIFVKPTQVWKHELGSGLDVTDTIFDSRFLG